MLLKLKNVCKTYKLGGETINALNQVSIEIAEGEFLAIMGPSGSGKSTFLQVASFLNTPTSGEIYLKEKSVTKYSEREAARLRNREIGFIFQQFNLLARTSAIDNVALPLVYANVPERERRRRAQELLEKVGLGNRLSNTPSQLSGGQQQRVAIARALVNNPSIIFADEPTGNLDSQSGEEIKKILRELHHEGRTVVLVTHEAEVAEIAKRTVLFHDGEILYDQKFGYNAKLKNPKTQTYLEHLRKQGHKVPMMFAKKTGK